MIKVTKHHHIWDTNKTQTAMGRIGLVGAILRAGAAPPFKWVRLGVVGAMQSGVLLWAGAAPPIKIGRRGDVGAI